MDTIKQLTKYCVEAKGYRRIVLLAVLAFVSALLSQFAQIDPWKILYVNWPHVIAAPATIANPIHDFQVPILPGLYFGSILSLGAYVWKRNNLFALCIILFSTMIAWIVAAEFAAITALYLEDYFKNSTDLLIGSNKLSTIYYISAGIVGGLVGGVLTLIGISFVTPDFRTINNWSRTLFISALAGTLLAYDMSNRSLYLLFIAWQVSVAASIAFGWSFQETLKVRSQPDRTDRPNIGHPRQTH